jgi:hypothetical protein
VKEYWEHQMDTRLATMSVGPSRTLRKEIHESLSQPQRPHQRQQQPQHKSWAPEVSNICPDEVKQHSEDASNSPAICLLSCSMMSSRTNRINRNGHIWKYRRIRYHTCACPGSNALHKCWTIPGTSPNTVRNDEICAWMAKVQPQYQIYKICAQGLDVGR